MTSRDAERARAIGIAAHAGFGEAWGRFPDAFGPSYYHDEELFFAIIEAAFAKLSAAGFAVVPREATSTALNEGGTTILLEEGRKPCQVAALVWADMVKAADLARPTAGPDASSQGRE